jgi:hypothetical protein
MAKLYVGPQTRLAMIESGFNPDDIIEIQTVKLSFQELIAAKVEYIKTMFPEVVLDSFNPYTSVAKIHEIKMSMLEAGLYHRKNCNVDAAIINLIIRSKGKKVPKRNYAWGKKWTT